MKKSNLGNSQLGQKIDDPKEPHWVKHQSLREIATIRESKKRDIVSRVLGVDPT